MPTKSSALLQYSFLVTSLACNNGIPYICNTHLHLVPVKNDWAIHLLPIYAFMAWTKTLPSLSTSHLVIFMSCCVSPHVAVLRLRHTERGLPPRLAARNLSYSILHHQWQTESGLTRRPAVGRSSHYSFVFEDSLSTRPVQDGHRKTDWPSEKQCFSL